MGVHNVKGAKTNRELWEGFERGGLSLVCLSAEKAHRMAKAQPLQKIKMKNNGAGYERPGYRDGYRNLPVKDIMEGDLEIVRDCRLYGFDIPIKVILH